MSLKPITSLLAAFIIGCLGPAFAAHADITVSVAGPFSGPNATYGDQYWLGASQAAADISTPPAGLMARKSPWCRGTTSARPNRRCRLPTGWWINPMWRRSSAIGHFRSSSTMPALEEYDDAGILAITPGSTNSQITERGMSNLFRM